MTQIAPEEAGSRLSQLIEDARGGEEIIITQGSTPVAKIVPLDQAPRRQPGSAKDIILYMADDFDATPDDFKDYL